MSGFGSGSGSSNKEDSSTTGGGVKSISIEEYLSNYVPSNLSRTGNIGGNGSSGQAQVQHGFHVGPPQSSSNQDTFGQPQSSVQANAHGPPKFTPDQTEHQREQTKRERREYFLQHRSQFYKLRPGESDMSPQERHDISNAIMEAIEAEALSGDFRRDDEYTGRNLYADAKRRMAQRAVRNPYQQDGGKETKRGSGGKSKGKAGDVMGSDKDFVKEFEKRNGPKTGPGSGGSSGGILG